MHPRVRRMPMHSLGLCSTVNACISSLMLYGSLLINKHFPVKNSYAFLMDLRINVANAKVTIISILTNAVFMGVACILARMGSTKF